MRRRNFLGVLGGAMAIWPLAARAQQPTIPVIGFLHAGAEAASSDVIAFRQGLKEAGYVEGQNIAIEYRWAEGHYDRLQAFTGEFVRRPVSLILAGSPPAALAAIVATTSIPIVFVVGLDPVAAGLVASFNKPGGNATGMTLITGPLAQKRLEFLREIAPRAVNIAMLVNPVSPDAAPEIRDAQAAAQANGLQFKMLNAGTPSDLNAAFASLAEQRPDALLVGADPFLVAQREQLIALVAHLGIPTIYPFREFAASGGLISYGTSLANAYHQAGIYAGRIIKGEKPTDLPVMQPTKFELVINLKSAKALGLDIPPTLLALTDEVIE